MEEDVIFNQDLSRGISQYDGRKKATQLSINHACCRSKIFSTRRYSIEYEAIDSYETKKKSASLNEDIRKFLKVLTCYSGTTVHNIQATEICSKQYVIFNQDLSGGISEYGVRKKTTKLFLNHACCRSHTFSTRWYSVEYAAIDSYGAKKICQLK